MLILASQSPRRQQLLREAGYDFQVVPPDPDAESGMVQDESVTEFVVRLARQKAANVAKKIASGTIVACDTVAFIGDEVLGKPRDRAHAEQMLKQLRGKQHSVFSGLVLWQRPSNRQLARSVESRLYMHPITDAELDQYLDSELWRGKSGAFGFQDGPAWLDLIEGSSSNVVGLPMETLADMLNVL